MLTHPITDRLRELGLVGMARALEEQRRHTDAAELGLAFLDRARDLLAAHDAALINPDDKALSLSVGISDHVLGMSLHEALRDLKLAVPSNTRVSVRLGLSQEMRDLYDRKDVDIAIIRRDGGGGDGEVLGSDRLDWFGAPSLKLRGEPLPLVLLCAPCGVRATAINAVEKCGLQWREAFTGGSCLALAAAIRAGVGIAPLGHLTAMGLSSPIDRKFLPPLPTSRIVMLARTPETHHASAANALATSIRRILHG